jgi:integrase
MKIKSVDQPHTSKNEKSLIEHHASLSTRFIKSATSQNTPKAYQTAVNSYIRWGGLLPATRDMLLSYLADSAEKLNPRTLSLHLTAISQWHKTQQLDDPTNHPDVRKPLQGIHRIYGKPKQKAKALRLEHLATMLEHISSIPKNLKKSRDKALLLIGFFGAFRRSELVSITYDNLTFEQEGAIITLSKSKTDQECEGVERAIPYNLLDSESCPVLALKAWLEVSNIGSGFIFRSVNRWGKLSDTPMHAASINDILKSLGKACDFDFVPELSSHSFRRGLSTAASRENVDFALIKKQGGWKNDDTVRGYIEEGQMLSDNAAFPLFERLSSIQKND